jgi:thymidine kinase
MAAQLIWKFGTMNGGKSLALLSLANNFERIGKKVAIFTCGFDDRFGVGKVTSRIGVSKEAELFHDDTVFTKELIGEVSAVLIDEGQFLKHFQVVALLKLAAFSNVPVYVFGLRTDFAGNGFEGSLALGILADKMEEIEQVCACERKASFQIRVDAQGKRVRNGEQVQIGTGYVQKCPVCFYSDEE